MCFAEGGTRQTGRRELPGQYFGVMGNDLVVAIGDMKLTQNSGRIITYALGSCVGITFWDPGIKLGALLHVLLPSRMNAQDANIFKYADTGIPETVRQLTAKGLDRKRTVVKIAGGAKMFETSGAFGDIGKGNIEMVKKTLPRLGFAISAEDLGANYARTMTLDVATGEVLVKVIGKPDKRL